MIRKDNKSKRGVNFMVLIGKAMENTSLGFYLAISGVVLQFVHNLLAVAGIFGLFNANTPLLLTIGEWILVFVLAYFLGMSLLYFTLKLGMINTEGDMKKETKEQRLKIKKKYVTIVNWFQGFDTLVDLYFWIFIIFMNANIKGVQQLTQVITRQWSLLIVIIPIVVMLPQTLRFYSNEIEFFKYKKEKEKQ